MKKNTVPKGIKIKMSREEIAYQIFIAVVVGLLVLCCLIPFLYVVGMSFHVRRRDDSAKFLRYRSTETDLGRL